MKEAVRVLPIPVTVMLVSIALSFMFLATFATTIKPEQRADVLFQTVDKDTGEPVAGAKIKVFKGETDELIAELTTASDGTATLTIEAGGYDIISYKSPTYGPNDKFAKEGSGSGIEITEPVTTILLELDSNVGFLVGQVKDADTEEPILGVKVTARVEFGDVAQDFLSTKTTEDGLYAMRLPVGKYGVLFSHPLYENLTVPSVEIDEGMLLELDVVLTPKPRIEGTEGDDVIVINEIKGRIVVNGVVVEEFNGSDNNVFAIDAKDGKDKVIIIGSGGDDEYGILLGDGDDVIKIKDGKGNDRYLIDPGKGKDKVVVKDGAGNDEYLFGPIVSTEVSFDVKVKDSSGNDSYEVISGRDNNRFDFKDGQGDDSYFISAGAGNDLIKIKDGAGKDTYAGDGGEGEDSLSYKDRPGGEDSVNFVNL